MENEKKKIEDFGNKIGGAKKDLTTKKKQNLTIEDTAYWNDMERKEFIKKKTVWVEPDYKQMIDEGVDKVCVYFIKLIRDKLPAKPTLSWNASNDIKEQEKYITFISDVRDMVLQVKNKEDIKNITNKIIDTYTEGRYSLNSYFTNKLYRVLRMSCNTVEHEMNDKQFLWEDKDKLLAAYNIGKVSDVAHSNDRNRLDVTEETETGTQRGKFYYSSENNNRFFSENDWEKGTYYIYDNKRQILDINFETKEDAEKYILQYGNIESSRKEAKRKKRFVPPLLKVIRREGSDYRQNTDADGQTMLNTFNFYGGEFGNWERQTERQMNLNFAYDAFKDLAYALDVDDKDVSLDGNLSLAFGARGSGNALAHYEKIANVINLTRMKGAGSLAHEFGHALDSFIARATGKTKAFATETSCDVINNVMDIIKYKKDENGYPQHTDFYAEAMKMDGEYTGYWAKNVELFARAFACYVKDKLAEKGMVNDYLCGHCESAGTSGEERTKINEAFDEMFAMLKERDVFHTVNHEVVANAIKEEQIVEENKPVEPDETIDYSDCIDILKGRMSISGSLLNKMSKWDYTDDSRNEIYSEWVSDYSDKVSFIFNPAHIHNGNYELPYKNKAFWEYYLKHSDEILNKVFDYVYDVAIEEGDKTREVLSEEIMRGSGFQDGKFRINAYYSEPHKANELADFLKEEYGIGGRCSDGRYESHDSKGIAVTVQNRVYDFTWNEVAKAIKSAIDEKSYITQKDVAGRVHNARFHLENFADSLTEQEIRKYTEILAEYGLGIANIYEQELIELVKEQIRENDGVFSEHYSVNNAPHSFHLPEGTMSITETATKYHVADYRYDVEAGKFIVSGHTNSDVREMIKEALETSLSEKATEKKLKDIPGLHTTDITTHSPVGNEIKHSTDREQNIAQKGNATMNTAIIGTVDYKNIKIKRYININSVEECQKLADELTAQGVPFSGRIQYDFQKGTITVSPENYKTALDVLEKIRTHSPVEKKNTTIGNKPYKYIADKKYINANEEDIRKLAEILTREGFEFSGNIYNADKAAITVSGAENQKLANAYLYYVRNTTVVNHITEYGFTLIDVQALTVKDKNDNIMSFENYEQMENAFNDIENEFFHPTYYQIGLTSDAFNGVYAVQAMDSTTGKEKHIEKDSDGYYLTFDTVADAISYVQANNISISNTDAELEDWKKRDAAIHLDKMQELIAQFDDKEHLIINEDETITWTYFNPDGNDGNGQLVEMYLNINVVAGAYEAYKNTPDVDFNVFFEYINENAETHLIDADREDFESHAMQFIAEKDNDKVYFLTTYSDELIERLTDNFTDIRLAKQAEKLDLDAISAETAYDMAVQASMNVYDKSGNIMSVETFAESECYATAADVQKWGQIETIADFVDEINSYVSDNPSVNITEYQRDANEEGYAYAIGASEWENTARSISQGKYEWLKAWLNDVKRTTIFDDISVLTENAIDILNDYEATYYASEVTEPESEKATEDIAKIISDKQNEMKEAMNAGNYSRVAEIAQELNTLTSLKKELDTTSPVRNKPEELTSFIDDEEKMRDFRELSKEEFLASYSYLTEEEYDMTEREAFHLTIPELNIDVDMRTIDHIEIQYPDDKQLFYYSTNSNDIEEGWEGNDFYDAAVTIPYIHGQLLTAKAEGYEINIKGLDIKTVSKEASHDTVDILAEKLTAHHPGKFMIEEYYNSKTPSDEELSAYIQRLVLSDRQGFGLDGYSADTNGIILSDLSKYSWEQVGKAVMTALEKDTYITAEERAERANAPKYSIYQVKKGEEYSRLSFNSWNELKKFNLPFDKNNYEEVYGGYVSDVSRSRGRGVVLDNIYTKFNIDRPEDFRGHSITVGDVIVLEDNNVSSAFYVDSFGMTDVTDLFFEVEKQKIDISKLSEITLTEEYDRRKDQPDDFLHIKNTVSFSNLDSSFLINRYKEFTYEYDDMPDADEGDSFTTKQGMLAEVQEFFEDSRSDSAKSISITDMNGNTTVLEGRLFEFEATEDRLAFMIPNVGYAEMFERDDDSYDYTFYDGDYNVIDSGVYDDVSISLRQAFTVVMEDAGYDIEKCEPMDFEKLQEIVEASNNNIAVIEESTDGLTVSETTDAVEAMKSVGVPIGISFTVINANGTRFVTDTAISNEEELKNNETFAKYVSELDNDINTLEIRTENYLIPGTSNEDGGYNYPNSADIAYIENNLDDVIQSYATLNDNYDIGKVDISDMKHKSLAPSIEIDFTESIILYNFLQEHNNNISLALASAVLEYLDNKQFKESRDEKLPDVLGYDKTAITINIPVNGSMVSFSERYDIGDGSELNGKLSNFLDHIGMPSEASAVKAAETLTAEEQRMFDAFVSENPILTAPELEEPVHSPVGNENSKPILASPSAIKSGDKFTMDGEVYTVVDKPVIYPDDVVIQKTEVSGNLSYEVTSNINRNKLFENYTYIGDGTEHRLEPDTAKKPENADTRDYRITSDDFNNGGGLKTRFRHNIEAIKTLKSLENNGRAATAEEQAVLAKYVGWGGIQEAFDDTKPEWRSEYNELKSLLSEREYADAKSSVNNAHYTSPVVINAIYSALDNIGFKSGNILEPAMGTGNFFGTMPEEMKDNSTLSGVELDEITGRIAQQLYQSANITVSGFERTNFKNNYFDVAIGNVPFGDYKVYDKEYNNLNFKIHDYFFAKSLDKVHPGGVVAFVTSQGTMDKKDENVRKYLAQRAELLGAIRLPNNAFKGIAGTDVTTDIIFLQKRDKPIEIEADWISRDVLDSGIEVNKYFAEHPEMILGEMVEGNKMFGSGTMCVPIEGKNLKEQLAEAVKNIKGEYKEQEKTAAVTEEATIYAPVDSKKFSYIMQDDKLFYRKGENTMSPANVKSKDIPQIKALCEIRDELNTLLNVQINNLDGINADAIATELNALNKLYDNYVDKYGRLSAKETANVFGEDASYQLIKALEVNDSNGNFERKADVMEKALIKPRTAIKHVDNASDALLVSLSEKFKVDVPFMANITGMDEAYLISELEGKIYQNPENGMNWETDNEYLSGNVREKLDAAKAAGLEKNVAALESVLPETVEAVDIKVRLGSSWIDPKYMKDFIVETFGIDRWSKIYGSLSVEYSKVSNDWKISGYKNSELIYNVQATDVFGTKDLNGLQILEKTLNLKTIEIKKDKLDEFGYPVHDINGNTIKVTDTKATEIAQAKQEMLQNKFKEWIFNDPDRRAYLVEKYNRLFNSTKLREYDGSHLNFVGMNENIKLNPHQVNAVARGLSGGNTLLAHEVGAGKTFEMIAIAMEGKRLGLHNKSMIAVPNHLTEQTGQAFRDLYPSCNILVATEKDFKPENRKAMMAKIATGDWDAVIVGHSQFDMCALSEDKQREYINAEIDDLETALEAAKRDGQNSLSVKSIERSKKSLEEKLNKLNDKQRKDDFIEFEKLGIDKLFIDESQEYKNLSTATKMNNVSGVVSKGSAKALQLLMKCKYMDEKTGGNGIVFASGTPISNSMTEMYTLSRYLQADKLEKMGIDSFDKWASVFGETETSMEVKPTGDGQYQNKTRFAHFINLPELQTMFREVADVKLASSLNIERPEAKVHNVNVPASRYQRRYVKKLGNRAEACRTGAVDKHVDNMLKITTDGRKIGLDARCIDPNIPDEPDSKVNICINNVFDIWKKTKEQKSTQLIFCDLATPQKPSKDDKYYIFRKQEDGSYANIFSGGIRTKDKSPERVLESLKKKLPKEFVEDEQCGVLEEGDIVVSETYDIEGGMIEHSGLTIGEGGNSTPITGVELNDIGMPAEVPYEQTKTFCVYDDIKSKLVKMGVPENEIAFIHDCKNNEEKQQLFDKMNKGEVRVMIGSTQKCGAGMNAQAKMIALHDLDAPYRPSDMGQRHGRIERRGNENKEVDIYRYMTEKTFDSYLYQLLENKQTFISQVMTEKLSLRVCEDIDESVLDFADAKALCSGNPLAKEKGELMKRISTLNNLKSGWNAARYKMQDAIKDAPRKISICEKAISLYEQDKATVMSVPKVTVGDKEGYPITINGKEYADRAEGGKALVHMIDSNMNGLHSGEVVEIGKYRGMTINAIATALWNSDSKEIKLEVVGAKRYYTTAVNMESNRYEGNLIRLDNVLDKFDNLIAETKNELAAIKKSVTDAEISINAPFENEAELNEKTARLEVVNAELLAADNEKNAALEIYETLTFIAPEIEEIHSEKSEKYFVSDNNTKPFIIQALGDNKYLAARKDICNGDVMVCDGVTFTVDRKEKTVDLLSYRNDYEGEYAEFDAENPAQLSDFKKFLEMVEFIDNNEYVECSSSVFYDKLNASENYLSRIDRVGNIADKIAYAINNDELDINRRDEHVNLCR